MGFLHSSLQKNQHFQILQLSGNREPAHTPCAVHVPLLSKVNIVTDIQCVIMTMLKDFLSKCYKISSDLKYPFSLLSLLADSNFSEEKERFESAYRLLSK